MKKSFLIPIIYILFCPIYCKGQTFDGVFLDETEYIYSIADKWINEKSGIDITSVQHVCVDNDRGFSNYGWTHETYSFEYKGIPLEYSTLNVHKLDGEIVSINGHIYSDSLRIDITPSISETKAFQCALDYLGAKRYSWEADSPNDNKWSSNDIPQAKLVICPVCQPNHARVPCLTYRFDIMAIDPFFYTSLYVDAHTGRVVHTNSLVNYVINGNGSAHTKYSNTQNIRTSAVDPNYEQTFFYLYDDLKKIHVYNGGDSTNLQNVDFIDNNNTWELLEHSNNRDYAAIDAHWGLEVTYDYFSEKHNRNSIDNQGMDINAYVHTTFGGAMGKQTTCNAAWREPTNSSGGILMFGDGDTEAFNPDTPNVFTSLDIVAHEYGHGVVYYAVRSRNNTQNGLEYLNESGAISEGLADIWGACVKDYANNNHEYFNINKNVWLQAREIYLQYDNAHRNMAYPKAYHQPDTYQGQYWHDYNINTSDAGGVHTNSGVMNYWFYLLSEGGQGTNDQAYHYSVTGIGIDDAAVIVYHTICYYLEPYTDYLQMAAITREAAIELYGICSQETRSVINAWKAVGVPVEDVDTVHITTALNSNSVANYYAYSLLTASNLLQNGATARYESNNMIRFIPNFKAQRGSHVTARIIDCPDNNSSSPSLLRAPMAQGISNGENDIRQSRILVSPNPVSDKLTVYGIDTENSSYIIYDNMGKLVKAGKLATPWQINVSNLPRGTYVLRIYCENSCEYVKFIKK